MAKKVLAKKITRYQPLYIIPIILLFLIYPFLAKYYRVANPLLDDPSYFKTEYLSDIFLYVKSNFLIFISVTMICVFACDFIINVHLRESVAKSYKQFIPLGVYAIFILLSTLLAENKQLALSGMTGQFENVWVLLSYLGICIFGYWYFTTVEKKIGLLYCFLGSSLLMGILFFLQFLGLDPYVWLFSSQNATVAVAGVYGGFFNPNYLGSYVNLILPLLVASIISFRDKKIIALPFGLAIILTVLGLIGSKTTGGLIAILLIFIFALLFFMFKKLHLSAKKFFITLGTLIIIGTVSFSAFISLAGKTERYLSEHLSAIYTLDDCLEIHRGDDVLYIRTEHTDTDFYLFCTNECGEKIQPVVKDGAYTFEDDKYFYFSIKPYRLSELDNIIAFELKYCATTWYFTNDYGDGSYYYITSSGGFAKSTPKNSSLGTLFTNVPKFMSGRGYIWAQSIPMLKDTLLIGYGPDNFAAQFPNHNFVAALRGGFTNTYISKPHNMYLQLALQTGLPSLIAFFVFYLFYFVKSVKLYLAADIKSPITFAGIGIFFGTVGYMVIGLINDSSITVAPFFWFLLGIGLAINHLLITETS